MYVCMLYIKLFIYIYMYLFMYMCMYIYMYMYIYIYIYNRFFLCKLKGLGDIPENTIICIMEVVGT